MPPKKRSSEAAEEYESDGGFVEDAPKTKKTKTSKATKSERSSGSKPAGEIAGGGTVGKDGEVYWELSGKRRVGVTEFKGNLMINIREYYEKDGELLPGKKGISLPIDQYNSLIKLLPHIEPVLAEKGQSIVRPNYSLAKGSASAANGEDEEEEEEEVKGKKNFEETSDEE